MEEGFAQLTPELRAQAFLLRTELELVFHSLSLATMGSAGRQVQEETSARAARRVRKRPPDFPALHSRRAVVRQEQTEQGQLQPEQSEPALCFLRGQPSARSSPAPARPTVLEMKRE